MATKQAKDLGGVYRQRKSTATTGSKNLKGKRDPVFASHEDAGPGKGSVGSGSAQPAALLMSTGRKELNSDYDDVELILREFDMNMAFGPCIGMTRLERWNRASELGLNPPYSVKELLEKVGGDPACLWEGRV